MIRTLSVTAILLASAAPAWAQRADENAVEAADDAFGTSVGNQNIGLYDAGDVRGFSPITAGNIRLEGLAVTEHGGFTGRVVSGSTIRVGLTAQSYPFPAPTGIADYTLRTPGEEAVLSPVIFAGPYGTRSIDLDAQVPLIPGRLGIAGGLGYRFEEHFPGETGRIFQAGAVARLRPSDAVEIKPFYGRIEVRDDRTIPSIFTAGPYLPPRIARRDFGADWAQSDAGRHFYGAVTRTQLTPSWLLQAGLFRWDSETTRGRFELYREVQPDGTAQRTVVANANQGAASTSGELRSSHSLTEGPRRHTLHLAARGRDTARVYGGSDVRNFGPARIGERPEEAEPDFNFGPQSRDAVRQLTGGLGYELRWLGLGELSLGLQKTDYSKTTVIPAGPVLTTEASPWLYNGTLAVHLTDRLVAYAGYTRGLEESGSAPQNAVNRNTAPPALMTSQRDAGLRFAVTPKLNLVAGLFDVRKPYFNIDPDRVYRELGTVRHRGIELSLAGQPVPGLSLVAGAVLLDADVSGEAVDLEVIGPKPVGTTARFVRANLDYRLPFAPEFSMDFGVTSQAGEVASTLAYDELGGQQLMTQPRTIFDVGGRYRMRFGEIPVTLRAQVTNLFDTYRWKVSSNSSFRFNDERRFLVSLAADI